MHVQLVRGSEFRSAVLVSDREGSRTQMFPPPSTRCLLWAVAMDFWHHPIWFVQALFLVSLLVAHWLGASSS